MKALYMAAPNTVGVREVPRPEIQEPTDAIIRIIASSICGSDLHIVSGEIVPGVDFPIGHESIGEVLEVGPAVRNVRIGDRVVTSPCAWCGSCAMCLNGNIGLCTNGGKFGSNDGIGGLQAEFARIPFADQDLFVVPDGVSDTQALAASDSLTTGWGGVAKALGDRRDGRLLVIGCGPVGLSAILVARRSARQVVAIDRVPERLELARRLGADVVLGPDDDLVARGREVTAGWGFDGIVETVAASSTLSASCELVAPSGVIAVLGTTATPFSVDLLMLFFKSATLWTGFARPQDTPDVLAQMLAGRLDPTPIFTDEISLDEAPRMYDRLLSGDLSVSKAIIRP